jgi:hypothetical protein
MTDWSLPNLLNGLHHGIEHRLTMARTLFEHPVMKGDASEIIWLEFLKLYLPKRYQVTKAVVVDSKGQFSDAIDIVVHDRQYTPFIFSHEGQSVVPAESVYAVFEAKQSLSASQISYAGKKAASVRKLHRTSLAVPNIYGRADPQPLQPVLAGVLTLESEWTPPINIPHIEKANELSSECALDIGCVAAHGIFSRKGETIAVSLGKTPTTAFLFELIAQLQERATVPMIDIRSYAAWLEH